MSEAGNPYSAEGDSLLLDPDLYDADTDDIPDPGLLKEKNGEVALPGPPPTPPTPPRQQACLPGAGVLSATTPHYPGGP